MLWRVNLDGRAGDDKEEEEEDEAEGAEEKTGARWGSRSGRAAEEGALGPRHVQVDGIRWN